MRKLIKKKKKGGNFPPEKIKKNFLAGNLGKNDTSKYILLVINKNLINVFSKVFNIDNFIFYLFWGKFFTFGRLGKLGLLLMGFLNRQYLVSIYFWQFFVIHAINIRVSRLTEILLTLYIGICYLELLETTDSIPVKGILRGLSIVH